MQTDDSTIDSVSDEVSPFDTISDVELTRKEQFYTLFDEYVRASFKIVWGDIRARIGGIILLYFLFMGTVMPYYVREPRPRQEERLLKPFQTLAAPLGTDDLGRDLFAQVVHATPPMFEMILVGSLFVTLVSVSVGLLAGFKGGIVDSVLMSIADIALTLPGLPLTIVLVVLVEPEQPWVIGLLLMVNAWGGSARSLRAETLKLREATYVESSKVLGLPSWKIVLKDILPNIMPLVFMGFMRRGRAIIFSSVALYFLGVLPFTTHNWGVILNFAWGANAVFDPAKYHWLLVPIVVIVTFTFGLTLMAQSTDRLFNPRVRARHAKSTPDDEQID